MDLRNRTAAILGTAILIAILAATYWPYGENVVLSRISDPASLGPQLSFVHRSALEILATSIFVVLQLLPQCRLRRAIGAAWVIAGLVLIGIATAGDETSDYTFPIAFNGPDQGVWFFIVALILCIGVTFLADRLPDVKPQRQTVILGAITLVAVVGVLVVMGVFTSIEAHHYFDSSQQSLSY